MNRRYDSKIYFKIVPKKTNCYILWDYLKLDDLNKFKDHIDLEKLEDGDEFKSEIIKLNETFNRCK